MGNGIGGNATTRRALRDGDFRRERRPYQTETHSCDSLTSRRRNLLSREFARHRFAFDSMTTESFRNQPQQGRRAIALGPVDEKL